MSRPRRPISSDWDDVKPKGEGLLGPATCSSAGPDEYERIRPEEAKIGDEFYGRMLTWEVIKTRFQVTGVQVQKPSCRRKRQNIPS